MGSNILSLIYVNNWFNLNNNNNYNSSDAVALK